MHQAGVTSSGQELPTEEFTSLEIGPQIDAWRLIGRPSTPHMREIRTNAVFVWKASELLRQTVLRLERMLTLFPPQRPRLPQRPLPHLLPRLPQRLPQHPLPHLPQPQRLHQLILFRNY